MEKREGKIENPRTDSAIDIPVKKKETTGLKGDGDPITT